MQFLTVIGQFAYWLRFIVLRFCMCHGLYSHGTQKLKR